MVYECQACFTTFKERSAGKDTYGKLECPSCGYGEFKIVSSLGDSKTADEHLRAYKDAWKKLQEEVLDEKTGWGQEERKKKMDKLLIECMEIHLKQ